MTVTYEITAMVDPALAEQYEHYMRRTHIPDLLRTGHFHSASISKGQPAVYRVRYEAKDRESLDRYLADEAPRLRDDFSSHFPTGVDLTRAEWEILETW